ncbi:hypothetical protein HHS_05210 [Candidatus Pantoea carbekii]|uniref:Uncharacterized protein n=1 Tax=Candidatus Pantoea carbekii TaxID=1235990 RepID=U3U2W2_9GAMM|nr:hypothetical protein HHS_05210 [Candidatus Pantoea carbekii]
MIGLILILYITVFLHRDDHGLNHTTLIAASIAVKKAKIIAAFISTPLPTPHACMTISSLCMYRRPKVIKIAKNKLNGKISFNISVMPKPNIVKINSFGNSPHTTALKIFTSFWQKKINSRINQLTNWLLKISLARYLTIIRFNTPLQTDFQKYV